MFKNKKIIFDIKTIRSIDSWKNSVRDYGYHIQAYLYQYLLASVTGLENMNEIKMFFILIEKETNYLAVREIDELSLLVAERQISKAIENYKDYIDLPKSDSEYLAYDLSPISEGLPEYIIQKELGD